MLTCVCLNHSRLDVRLAQKCLKKTKTSVLEQNEKKFVSLSIFKSLKLIFEKDILKALF